MSEQYELLFANSASENPEYLQTQIITYLGNKRSLLPFIGEGVRAAGRRLGKRKLRLLDLFSGSGIVARYFKQFAEYIAVNDMEDYSRITNLCYLSNKDKIDIGLVRETVRALNGKIAGDLSPGFITEMYSPKDEDNITQDDRCFYTRRNAMFLDTALRETGNLPPGIKNYILAPLIARASVHANTSGVFKGFYKNKDGVGQFGGNGRDALRRIFGNIELDAPVLSNFSCDFDVFQGDANEIINDLPEVDLAYFDPPYNQHPYGSNYFMLNLLARYERPRRFSEISGIPDNWNRSRYNQRKNAEAALFDLVMNCRAKFILISYNSEGFIKKERFLGELAKHGKITVLEASYNTFRGSRNLQNRPIHVTEFLYLIEKN
jgi:adenine-specific DNA-methyltransferase